MRPSNPPSRRRLRFSTRVILVLVALIAIGLAWRMNRIHQEASAVHHIEELGGHALYDVQAWSPGWAEPLIRSPVVTVDLSGSDLDARDLEQITALDELERLNLQDTTLGPGDFEALAELEQLQVLRLAGTRITDSDLVHLQKLERLRVLSLSGTDVGDQGLKHLSGLASLEHLELTGTDVTASGLGQLRTLRTLSSLHLDDRRITSQTVKQLRALPGLQSLYVTVPSGVAAEAYQHLAAWPNRQVQVQAVMPPHERVLWDVSRAWKDSTGGLVDLLAAAAKLDAQQVDVLRSALASVDGDGHWDRPRIHERESTKQLAEEFADFDEFLAALKEGREDNGALNAFATYRVTRDDIPQLVEAMHAMRDTEAQKPDCDFWTIGTRLLIRLGLGQPEALKEVKRRLQHEDPKICARTVWSFVYWGYFEEPQKLTDQEAQVALSLLVAATRDPDNYVRGAAADTLGAFVRNHPEAATEVVTAVAPLIGSSDHFVRSSAGHALQQAMRADPDLHPSVAQQLFPLLDSPDREIKAFAIEALGSIGQANRELAITVAEQLLARITDEDDRISQAAGTGLGHLVESEHDVAPIVVPALLGMFQARDADIQASAASALANVAKAFRDKAADE